MPLTAAKIGFRSWGKVEKVGLKSWRWRSHCSFVMPLRWRRSLPTENAWSPAPVMIATRTAGRIAMVSRISVRRAPISVVIALSACGRLSVIRAICSPAPYSRSTGESGSSPAAGGGPKSRVFQRSVGVVLVATVRLLRSGLELRKPAECAQAGGKAVLAAAGYDERRQFLQAAPYRPVRKCQRSGPVVRADERILLGGRADEDAVVQPLRLHELELAVEVRAREDEH